MPNPPPGTTVPPYISVGQFSNGDLATIWSAIANLDGSTAQNIKIFASVIPADCTLPIRFNLPDLGIGQYLFQPKSLQVTVVAGGVGLDRFLILEKYLDGFPVNLLARFTNQTVGQTDATIEDYYFLSDNCENDATFDYGGNTIHTLALPSAFELRFNGSSNNDYLEVVCKNGLALDVWQDAAPKRIVLVGDVVLIS